MKIRRGGVTRELVNGYIFYLGSRRRLQTIKQLRGGSLVTIASFIQPLSAEATDVSNDPGLGDTTGASTCVVTGGVPPYSYAWVRLSGVSLVINTPTLASTTFRSSDFGTAQIRVTVTDGRGVTASDTITAAWAPA